MSERPEQKDQDFFLKKIRNKMDEQEDEDSENSDNSDLSDLVEDVSGIIGDHDLDADAIADALNDMNAPDNVDDKESLLEIVEEAIENVENPDSEDDVIGAFQGMITGGR